MPRMRPAVAAPLFVARPEFARLIPIAPKMMARALNMHPSSIPRIPSTSAAVPKPFCGGRLDPYCGPPNGLGCCGADQSALLGCAGGQPGVAVGTAGHCSGGAVEAVPTASPQEAQNAAPAMFS